MGLSAVSGAGCLECQLVYSSKSLLPVVKLWRRGGGGWHLAAYLQPYLERAWVHLCLSQTWAQQCLFFFFFLQWKEIDEVGVIQ